ncbi:MAG: transposase [Selenomonadaceae bacterium]|nr:transposase [Selenomonadaceae bacterium]
MESKKVGRPPLNPRKVFNAIIWILKSGARWRDLPARLPCLRLTPLFAKCIRVPVRL